MRISCSVEANLDVLRYSQILSLLHRQPIGGPAKLSGMPLVGLAGML
jgi:hypothetical protein